MEETNNQPGFIPPVGEPSRVNPISPDFMNAGTPVMPPIPPMPNNPPMGEIPSAFVPPPIPPSPSATPVMNSPVSPPPPKQVDIRTMASDQSSFKASGGMGVTPQTVKPIGKVFKKVDSAGKPAMGSKKKALFIGLGIVVFLAAAAAVANFFVLPIFFPDVELNEAPPAIIEEPIVEAPIVTPTVPLFTHASYFTEPVDVSTTASVGILSLPDVKTALNQIAAGEANGEAETITEFQVTQGPSGSPVTTNEFLAVMLPDVQFTTLMEEDFTGFMYDAGTEVFVGYIFALDAETQDLTTSKTLFEDTLEASTQIANLFLLDPGTPSTEGFKIGTTVGGVVPHWLAYSNANTSIDYGWKGPFVVISTSFEGFKEVAPKVMSALPVTAAADTTIEDTGTATTTET